MAKINYGERLLNILKEFNDEFQTESVNQNNTVEMKELKIGDMTLYTDNEELKVDDSVYKMVENEKQPADNGDYEFEGVKITVADGKITNLEEIKVEDKAEETPAPEGEAEVKQEDAAPIVPVAEANPLEDRLKKVEDMLSKLTEGQVALNASIEKMASFEVKLSNITKEIENDKPVALFSGKTTKDSMLEDIRKIRDNKKK